MTALITAQDAAKLKDIVILDASMGPAAHSAYEQQHIPGAHYFDIDAVADPMSPYPHTLPSPADFASAVGALGINNDTHVIIYDQTGVSFAAARAWWMFRTFGHDNIQIINGGLPAWLTAGLDTDNATPAINAATYRATLNHDLYRSYDDVERISETGAEQIIDARGAPRFASLMRTIDGDAVPANIPGSLNLPFAALLGPAGEMKPDAELSAVLKDSGIDADKKLVTSCQSGVTACVVALGLFQAGIKNTAVFDGSWTEWSDRQQLR